MPDDPIQLAPPPQPAAPQPYIPENRDNDPFADAEEVKKAVKYNNNELHTTNIGTLQGGKAVLHVDNEGLELLAKKNIISPETYKIITDHFTDYAGENKKDHGISIIFEKNPKGVMEAKRVFMGDISYKDSEYNVDPFDSETGILKTPTSITHLTHFSFANPNFVQRLSWEEIPSVEITLGRQEANSAFLDSVKKLEDDGKLTKNAQRNELFEQALANYTPKASDKTYTIPNQPYMKNGPKHEIT